MICVASCQNMVGPWLVRSQEHSVANMFFIPLGIMLGAKVTFTDFLMNNLLPVTLGNTFAGVVFVACALGAVHGNLFNDDSKAAPLPANN
jgi:formate/nitrite transporter FocA (FNT family)